MPTPVVAIVGAPNVGKSTLFNRLLGRRRAIVADRPGVTRDRIMAEADLGGRRVTLVDTGGVIEASDDDLARRVSDAARKAMETADVVLFVVDARAGLTAADEHVAGLLRSGGRPVIAIANKIDSRGQEGYELELYRLGLGEVAALSAEQGRGVSELVDRVTALLPEQREAPAAPGLPVAIIGRPNVGKSSLFNRLVRSERSVVSERPGTTRDPIDATFVHDGVLLRVVDTAGIRRRQTGAGEVEWVSVLKAKQALEQADLAVALVDATTGVEHQDRALLGLVADGRVPAVLAVNKVDLLEGGREAAARKVAEIREAIRFAPHVPAVPVSARTGAGVQALLDRLVALRRQSERRFPTTELNRTLQAVIDEKHPPSDAGRSVRLNYVVQLPGAPPRFLIFGNGRAIHSSYRRFLEKRFRERLGLEGAPITLLFRRKASR